MIEDACRFDPGVNAPWSRIGFVKTLIAASRCLDKYVDFPVRRRL